MLNHDKCAAFEVVIEQQKKTIKNLEIKVKELEEKIYEMRLDAAAESSANEYHQQQME